MLLGLVPAQYAVCSTSIPHIVGGLFTSYLSLVGCPPARAQDADRKRHLGEARVRQRGAVHAAAAGRGGEAVELDQGAAGPAEAGQVGEREAGRERLRAPPGEVLPREDQHPALGRRRRRAARDAVARLIFLKKKSSGRPV